MVVTVAFFIPTELVGAHPGNTAADGCHYCWTNCDYWGETYGVRHCHGGTNGSGGYSGPSYSQQGTINGAKYANEIALANIRSTSSTEGGNDGEADGGSGNISTPSSNASTYCTNYAQSIKYDGPAPQEYISAYQASFTSTCIPIYNTSYDERYSSAYSLAKSNHDTEKKAADESVKQAENKNSYTGWYLAGAAAALYGVGAIAANYSEDIKKWWRS